MRSLLPLILSGFIALVPVVACATESGGLEVVVVQGVAELERGGKKKSLVPAQGLRTGDRILTGPGSALLKLQSEGQLIVRRDSDLWVSQIRYGRKGAFTLGLALVEGEVCIDLGEQDSEQALLIQLGSLTRVESNRGALCVTQEGELSAAQVLAGSIRIRHDINKNLIVLSEVGSQYFLWADGRSKLVTLEYDVDPSTVVEKKLGYVIEADVPDKKKKALQ